MQEQSVSMQAPAGWMPSRFTVKVQDEAGQWILYNSMTGAVGAVSREMEATVLPLLERGHDGALQGVAKDLADKGFLVARGIDESRRALHLKQRRQSARSLHLIVMPTEDCNFRCVYCYEAFARGKMPRSVREGIKNLMAKTLGRLDSLTLNWFGGEPMEAMEIIEELSFFMLGIARSHQTAYSSSITTNGWHLTPENLKRLLLCEVRNIQVTLDGLEHQHDGRRVLNGGGPTFERIWANLRAIRSVGGDFKLNIRINFNPETLDSLGSLLDRLAADFASDSRFAVFFRPLSYWGGPNDGRFEVCEQAPAETAIFESTQKAVDRGLQTAFLHALMQPGGSVCYAANANSFVVGSDGTLYKCTVALDKEFNKIGRLLSNGYMQVDADRFALWTTSDDSEDSVCQSCRFRPACQGAACPLIRIQTGQRPCPPEKKRMRQTLIALWKHYQRFGKMDFGARLISGPMD